MSYARRHRQKNRYKQEIELLNNEFKSELVANHPVLKYNLLCNAE